MTTDAEIGDQQAMPSEEAPKPYYYIDPARCAEFDRSLELMLLSRRCRTCRSKEMDMAHPPSVKEQIKHIVGCCAKDETFIRPEMPMQEIVFRMLLAGGNTSMSLDDLHYQLTEHWATPGNPMNISKEGLKRVLESDDFYGYREVPTEAAAKA